MQTIETKNSKIIFGTSQKTDGQMILKNSVDAINNRKKFFAERGANLDQIVSTASAHQNAVYVAKADDAGKIIDAHDALLTTNKNLFLTVTVGDCVPLFFYDKTKDVIAVAHAGWRGVLAEVATNVVKTMKNNYNSCYNDIHVFIGPHIHDCHFEVQEDVLPQFSSHPRSIRGKENKTFVSLEWILRKQLINHWINPSNIKSQNICTFCDKNYFSYRRDKPQKVESQIAYIAIID